MWKSFEFSIHIYEQYSGFFNKRKKMTQKKNLKSMAETEYEYEDWEFPLNFHFSR